MTDKEIIKGLECHKTDNCNDCPYMGYYCAARVMCDALDLVNRLQAENESLNELVVYNANCATRLHKRLFSVKAEAYKEFAERLKSEIDIRPTYSREQNKYVFFLIDNLLKEMVGEDK